MKVEREGLGDGLEEEVELVEDLGGGGALGFVRTAWLGLGGGGGGREDLDSSSDTSDGGEEENIFR